MAAAAYIPPHKRQSRGDSSSPVTPTPAPESLSPHFKRGLNINSSFSHKKNNSYRGKGGAVKAIYAQNSVSKWFPVGLSSSSCCCSTSDDDDDHDQFMPLIQLVPISAEPYERQYGKKPLSLVLNHDRLKECSEERSVFMENPWMFVAENVKQELLSAFERVQNEMQDNDFVQVKPTLDARFGKHLFHGGQSSLPESTSRRLQRSFYTNVSASYTEYIVNEVGPKFSVDFEEKEVYQVKLSDNMVPDNMVPESTISCKCTLAKDSEKLELYKIEWNPVRHLVVDMSCLDKDLDLRLILCTKKIMKKLTDDEIKCIKYLIGSAILDPEVKGGLRWPLGTDSSGDRYAVVGVWRTSTKAFKNSSIRLKVRYFDRFDFKTSSGEVSRAVTMVMPGLVSHFQEQEKQDDLFTEMLRSNLKLIWDNCLCSA